MENFSKNTHFAVLVLSCDAYHDAVATFFQLLRINWPDCAGKIYLVNNTREFHREGVTVINAGNEFNWVGRLNYALNRIDEEVVLVLFEDYFIAAPVDDQKIQEALDNFKREGLKYYRITNVPKFAGKQYKDYNHLVKIPKYLAYGVNLQAALWDRLYLRKLSEVADGTAWDFEVRLHSGLCPADGDFVEASVVDSRDVIEIRNGIIKGKWVPGTIKALKKIGVDIELGTRKTLSFWECAAISVKVVAATLVPSPLRRPTKAILSSLGFKFLSPR